MKHFISASLILVAGSLYSVQALAQQYTPTDQGSSIVFRIKNFGFAVDGSMSGIKGKIGFDPNALANAIFDVTLDASTINTGNEIRDGHLKKEDYFDVGHYPLIHFVSTHVTAAAKGGGYLLSGKLTIKQQTKDISFPFVATALGNDYIFKGDLTIDRKDFDIGGSGTISNALTVSLTIFATKMNVAPDRE
jgi:polyisoprenoid-binding protein YceI